jgi:hypothetical protein
VPGRRLARREFLRTASLGILGAAAACTGARPAGLPTATPSPALSPSPSPTGSPEDLVWRRLDAGGPGPRRDHTFTANDAGTIAFLFGGRAGGRPVDELWAFERSTGTWERIGARGPAARFGQSAAFVQGHLVIFGGQGPAGRFLDDAWAFDPVAGSWTELAPGSPRPAARSGAGGTRVGDALVVSHGLADAGGLDDTWALAARWTDVTPRSGPRPSRRGLHRTAYAGGLGRMLLFGGRGDGVPFLGDTWLYDPATQTWAELRRPGPPPRTLFAAGATARAVYVFGGFGAAGPLGDLWRFSNDGWRELRAAGEAPSPRGGADAAVMAGPSLLVFGGGGATGELADLFELSLPA